MSQLHDVATFCRAAWRHQSPLPNRVRALGRFVYRQAHKRIVGKPLTIAWEGMTLEIPVDSTSASAAYYFGRQDAWEFAFLERFLRPGDSVADVGANVGVYTLFLAKLVGATGKVFACEPEPQNLERLRGNVQKNQLRQVEIVPAAIGAVAGEAHFLSGQDSVGHLTDRPEGIVVPLQTLAATCAARPPIFVKVDVEGYEQGVIEGARGLMSAGMPLVWLLESPDFEEGSGRGELAGLASLGYDFFSFDPIRGVLVPSHPRDRNGNNHLAIRKGGQVAERLGTRLQRDQ